jgi:hypothetical protein
MVVVDLPWSIIYMVNKNPPKRVFLLLESLAVIS